jgi:ERCC4-type nuclease
MQDLVDQFASIKLSMEDRCTLIQLNCAKGFGGAMFRRLMEHFESVENLRFADRESILNVKGIGPKIADSLVRGLNFEVSQEFEYASKQGYDVITIF